MEFNGLKSIQLSSNVEVACELRVLIAIHRDSTLIIEGLFGFFRRLFDHTEFWYVLTMHLTSISLT